jgi:hypothetical protein
MYRGCFHPFLDRSEQTGHSLLADHPTRAQDAKAISVDECIDLKSSIEIETSRLPVIRQKLILGPSTFSVRLAANADHGHWNALCRQTSIT